MLDSARERVETFLSKLLKKHKSGTVGIVAPNPLAGLIESYLRQTDVREVWKNEAICGSWDLIEVDQPKLNSWIRGVWSDSDAELECPMRGFAEPS